MNNLYHKVAVASVCTALGFALGPNKEAKAATFSNYTHIFPLVTFHAIDGGSYGSFDGLGDTVTNVSYDNDAEQGRPHSWDMIERTAVSEQAALLEYSIPFIATVLNRYRENARITSITNAVLGIPVLNWPVYDIYSSRVLGVFGYVGNGTAEASDFEAGVFLNSTEITEYGTQYAEFNVTPFMKEIVSNNNKFAGFAVRSLKQNGIIVPRARIGQHNTVRLTISGEFEVVEPEPVPEPTTIFGSAIGLCLGGWLKRKKSSQQNKTKSQG